MSYEFTNPADFYKNEDHYLIAIDPFKKDDGDNTTTSFRVFKNHKLLDNQPIAIYHSREDSKRVFNQIYEATKYLFSNSSIMYYDEETMKLKRI